MNPESMDLTQIANAILAREISSTEITQWSIKRLGSIGKSLNAVFRIYEEKALERARELDLRLARGEVLGPLHGVPLAHKDLIGIKGHEMHAGSAIRGGLIADETAWVMQCMDRDGQVNLGSLHMAELALSPTGFNEHFGHPRNPWNLEHVCGGSSSGSGIAVAARLVFGSIGSDTGGSIRHPSAMCGVTGLKPTQGLVSVSGVFPLSKSLDCVGPIAQTARDCALLLDSISRFDRLDPLSSVRNVTNQLSYSEMLSRAPKNDLKGLKIAIPQEYYREDLDPEIAKALDISLEVLKALGATLHITRVPDMAKINGMMQKVMSSEAAFLHKQALLETPHLIAEQVRLRMEPGLKWSALEYLDAVESRNKIRGEFIDLAFDGCDLIHIPAVISQTPSIEESTRGSVAQVLATVSKLTYATRGINYLGLPAMSVPIGFTKSNMPIAMQLVAKPFEESVIFRVADQYQGQVDWHRRVPSCG